MNRTIKFAGAAVLAWGLAGAGVAAAQVGNSGEGSDWGHRGMRERHGDFMRALNLTDDQKAQLKSLREQQREQMKPVFEQQRALRQQIERALESDKPDATRIGQ